MSSLNFSEFEGKEDDILEKKLPIPNKNVFDRKENSFAFKRSSFEEEKNSFFDEKKDSAFTQKSKRKKFATTASPKARKSVKYKTKNSQNDLVVSSEQKKSLVKMVRKKFIESKNAKI